MVKLEKSSRLEEIEVKWRTDIKELFYNWHWQENLTHKEIASKVSLPRPTITRWFKQLQIPTQVCQRMTKRRWQIQLVKILKLIEKQKRKPFEKPCLANKHFFKKWTPEMAYVLGYFAADGSIYKNPRGACFVDFVSTDQELIFNTKRMFSSGHAIAELVPPANHKKRWRLQIGSKEIFNDLLKIGLTPRKSKIIELPKVPKEYFADFVRGNFDGDGCVKFGFYIKKGRSKPNAILVSQFASGSKQFLIALLHKLREYASIEGGSIQTKHDRKGDSYVLHLSINDSFRLFGFMYSNVRGGDFLRRKYNIFQKAYQTMRVWPSPV